MTTSAPESTASVSRRDRLWQVLGWVTASYSVLAALLGLFLIVPLLEVGNVFIGDVDWSHVAPEAKVSLWLVSCSPLWLPLAVAISCTLGAHGCFRLSRGRRGKWAMWAHAATMVMICALFVGSRMHLMWLEPAGRTGTLTTPYDMIVSLIWSLILLLPTYAAISLSAFRTLKPRDSRRQDARAGRLLRLGGWACATVFVSLIIIVVLHRPTISVVYEWPQPASTADGQDSYCLFMVETGPDWRFPGHGQGRYYLYVGRASVQPSYWDVANAHPLESPFDDMKDLPRAQCKWTAQGVELWLPSGRGVCMDKDAFEER